MMTATLITPPHETDPDRILGLLVRDALPAFDQLLTRLWQADALADLADRFESARTPAAIDDTVVELRRQVDDLMAAIRTLDVVFERLSVQAEASTLLAFGLPPIDLDSLGAG